MVNFFIDSGTPFLVDFVDDFVGKQFHFHVRLIHHVVDLEPHELGVFFLHHTAVFPFPLLFLLMTLLHDLFLRVFILRNLVENAILVYIANGCTLAQQLHLLNLVLLGQFLNLRFTHNLFGFHHNH